MSEADRAVAELESSIAVMEDNLHTLIEQAAAYSGGEDEDRSSDRIADLERELDAMKGQRDTLLSGQR